jgi:hypothetical protein
LATAGSGWSNLKWAKLPLQFTLCKDGMNVTDPGKQEESQDKCLVAAVIRVLWSLIFLFFITAFTE